jgi:photosystem II stability/assembly factor-like uncharacterized protein
MLLHSDAAGQWERRVRFDSVQINVVHCLADVGKPDVLAVGGSDFRSHELGMAVFLTTDVRRSWRTYPIPNHELGWLVDFSFKDSLVGWLATKGGPTSPFSGIYETTDGGMGWSEMPVLQGEMSGITYCPLNGALFATGFGSFAHDSLNFVSWDEGATWTELAPKSNRDQGKFVFIDSLHGIHTGFDDDIPKPGTYWYLTSDAGHSWTKLDIDSTSWEPVACAGSSTWFAITRFGCVMRTDDNWRTWTTLYRFPQQTDHAPRWTHEHPCSSWMGGDGRILFVQFTGGAYASCDSGVSWFTLHSPPSITVEFTRANWDGRRLYIPIQDSTGIFPAGELWSLDLSTTYHSSWDDRHYTRHLRAGEPARVLGSIENNCGDSVKLLVTFDPDVFTWRRAVLPTGWQWRGTPNNGSIELTIFRPPGAIHDTTFELEFGTTLAKPEATIVVQPLAVYVDSLYLPCLAERPQKADTLTALFDGCGNDILWHFMQTGQIFDLLSVSPNPAANELNVDVAERGEGAVKAEVMDVLGANRVTRDIPAGSTRFDISSLPSGTYFLRLSESGEVRTRRFVIER